MTYLRNSYGTRQTPQTQPIPGENQIKNNAGGYVYELNEWDRLRRFLILGSEGNTYYCSERQFTKENAQAIIKLIEKNGIKVVDTVIDISDKGLAPKNDPALFVLAMCSASKDLKTRQYALANLSKVARISTHLFNFISYMEMFRGWGRGMKSAVASWYNDRNIDNLINQVIKYQQREGWSHRDLLRLSHPKTSHQLRDRIYKYVTKGAKDTYDGLPPTIIAVEEIKKNISEPSIITMIEKYNLPMEVIPTQKRTANIYKAVLKNAGITWVFKNLGNMAKANLFMDWQVMREVCNKITDKSTLKNGRIHPIQVLSALNTYSQGHGFRGSGSWNVESKIVDALNDAFYISFENLEYTGKNIIIGLDVSGSMNTGVITGIPGLTPRVASSAMCLANIHKEENYRILAFCEQLVPLNIGKKDSIQEVCKKTNTLRFGRTDCAQPMLWAYDNKVKDIDAFIIYTDNETWYGKMHPSQALRQYRAFSGKNSKLIVCGMTSTNFSISSPNDKDSLDIVGLDASGPQLISNFLLNKI